VTLPRGETRRCRDRNGCGATLRIEAYFIELCPKQVVEHKDRSARGSAAPRQNCGRAAARPSHAFSGPINLGGGLRLETSNFGNQMISEDNLADGEGGPKSRYGIDPIIETQFAPHRLQILQDFLRYETPPVHSE